MLEMGAAMTSALSNNSNFCRLSSLKILQMLRQLVAATF